MINQYQAQCRNCPNYRKELTFEKIKICDACKFQSLGFKYDFTISVEDLYEDEEW